MSLPFDHPHLETGDAGAALSGWEVDGFAVTNNDHGRVYVRVNATTIEASRVRGSWAAGDLVASGPDVTPGSTLVLSPQNNSGLTIRAYRSDGEIGAGIVVWFFLANESDLRRKDNQLGPMLLRGEVDFLEPMRDTMREFYTRMAAVYPPPPTIGQPNDLVPSINEEGIRGKQEWYGQYFWTVNSLGEFEVTGLQNPGDFRLWFVSQCLALIYSRKARTGDLTDPIFSRQLAFQNEANRLWKLTKPWLDVDRNLVADRQPKVRNVRLRRG
jgi:hypothetical protein